MVTRRCESARLRQMHVGVDTAGQHEKPARVDRFRRRTEIVAEGGDQAVLDAHVGLARAVRGRDGAAADDAVERHHQVSVRALSAKM